MKDEKILSKYKESSLKTYGVDHPFKSTIVKDRLKKTLESKYGTNHLLRLQQFKDKSRTTNLERYGKVHKSAWSKEHYLEVLSLFDLSLVGDSDFSDEFISKCNICGREFRNSFMSSKHGTIPHVCPYCTKTSTRLEKVLTNILESNGFKVIPRERLILEGKEIDIYLPELKIGFEINGALTHNSDYNIFSNQPKSRSYHKEKTELALSKGVRLYHLWFHWSAKKIISVMLSKLGVFKVKYYARKLKVVIDPDKTLCDKFFDSAHTLGHTVATRTVALLDGNDIIQAFQFVKLSDSQYILSRNASLKGTSVIGGSAKIFKHFVKSLSKGTEITTYADRDLTPSPEDSVYTRLGFTFEGDSGQIMKYWVSDTLKIGEKTISAGVYARNSFMKAKLMKLGDTAEFKGQTRHIDWSLSESKILFNLGVYRVFNSGCFKFSFIVK